MLDVAAPEIVLQRSSIVPIVCELVAAGVAQHVRVGPERHFGGLAEALDEAMEADWAPPRSETNT
jgi:hypothetical protein